MFGVEEVQKFGDLEVHRIKKNVVESLRIRDHFSLSVSLCLCFVFVQFHTQCTSSCVRWFSFVCFFRLVAYAEGPPVSMMLFS